MAFEKGFDHTVAGIAHLLLGKPQDAIRRFHAALAAAEGATDLADEAARPAHP